MKRDTQTGGWMGGRRITVHNTYTKNNSFENKTSKLTIEFIVKWLLFVFRFQRLIKSTSIIAIIVR